MTNALHHRSRFALTVALAVAVRGPRGGLRLGRRH